MRRHLFNGWRRPALMATVLATLSISGYGQSAASGTPADSIQIDNISAVGDPATGQVQITMDFTNKYNNPALVHLVLGGFDGLGLTDDKGNKYKIHTSDQMANTAGINKGYINIPFVQFGDKTYKWLTFVEQKMPPGQHRQLTIRIPKVSTAVTEFNEINTRRQVSINYALVADKVIKLQNVKITWTRSTAKSK